MKVIREKILDLKNDFRVAFFLAWKSIQRGNKSSLILVIGIMMIVFLNLLFTDAIFAGITKGMNENKINYQYGEVIVEPKKGEDYVQKASLIQSDFKDNQYVDKVSQILKFGVTYTNQKEKDGRDEEKMPGLLMGIDLKNNTDDFVFDIKSKIVDGRMLQEGDVDKIIIGTSLAGGYGASVFPDDLGGVKVGDKILVERNGVGHEYEIVGIFKTKNFDVDARGVIPEKELRRLTGLYSGADEVIFRLKNPDDSKKLMKEIEAADYDSYEVSDWEEKLAFGAAINQSFEMIGSILRIIGSLVAGLVIFIIIFVDIVNKRRQVGILKAIGVKQKVIIHSYIIRGVFYAFLGSVFGYLLMRYGIIGAFERKPIDMPMSDVIPYLKDQALISSVMFFIVAGLIGSAIPAYKEIKKKILTLLYH